MERLDKKIRCAEHKMSFTENKPSWEYYSNIVKELKDYKKCVEIMDECIKKEIDKLLKKSNVIEQIDCANNIITFLVNKEILIRDALK